jgi:LysR family transcriptional regulator, hydrogen peroxide-inducible genes activator
MSTLRPHPFSLRQWQYALAVADGLSFRKAAERCHVSQPSLSAQLAQLEAALGVRLFERDRRRVLVSPAGSALLDRARQLLREADDLVDAATRAGDPFAGTLHIGVIPTVSPYLLPSIAAPLRQKYPRLTVAWVEDKTAVLVRRLATGGLDAALLALEADIGEVEHAVIARDPFVLAAAPGHALAASAAPAALSALRDAKVLLLDDGHCLRHQALAVCTEARAREQEFRATSLTTLAQMVAAGAGVTLLPQLAVATETARAALCTRPFADPPPYRTIAMVWRKRSALAAALRQVAATIATAYPRPGALTPRPESRAP